MLRELGNFISWEPNNRSENYQAMDIMPYTVHMLHSSDGNPAMFHAWCSTHCKGKYGKQYPSRFDHGGFGDGDRAIAFFELQSDAFMFKLSWTGGFY